jgi:hypothetical protein
MRVEAKTSARNSISLPVGRVVQAAVCKTAEAGAIPARDSISAGIGVDRHTSVFQTEIERALLSCPSTFPSESGLPAETPHGRSNGRVPDSVRLGFFFATRTPVPVRASQTWLRWFNSTFASRSCGWPPGLQTLTVKSRLLTGENSVRFRGDPPFCRCGSVATAAVL